jgi:hypothetical protein
MISILVLLLTSVADAAEDRTLAALTATVRTLCADQRADGAWTDPDSVVRVTVIDPPPAAGTPPREPPGPAVRFRPWVAELSAGAEALLMASRYVPEGRPAAERALLLAAQSLMADRFKKIDLDEAIIFLRAVALIDEERRIDLKEAITVVTQVFEQETGRRIIGRTLIGLSNAGDTDQIDLRLTWRAGRIIRDRLRSFLPANRDVGSPRVARYQPLLADVRTDRPQMSSPPDPFEDATLFAAALGISPIDAEWNASILSWIKPLCERTALEADPESLEAAAEALVGVAGPADSWWNIRLQSWTGELLARCKQKRTDAKEQMEWPPQRGSQVLGNAFGLRWLVRQQDQEMAIAHLRFNDASILPRLGALADLQRDDGTWRSLDGQRDVTAMAVMAFMMFGYDHLTPGHYRPHLQQGIAALVRRLSDQRSSYDMALDVSTLLEAYAMTNDQQLVVPVRRQVRQLIAAQLPQGGWAGDEDGQIDWRTTTMMMRVFQTAMMVGIDVPIQELAAWWFAHLEKGPHDPATIRMKALGVVFLEPRHAEGRRLANEFMPRFERLEVPVDEDRDWGIWEHATVMFLRRTSRWATWKLSRMMQAPVGFVGQSGIASLMADAWVWQDGRLRR